jgi:hypothetical protein
MMFLGKNPQPFGGGGEVVLGELLEADVGGSKAVEGPRR